MYRGINRSVWACFAVTVAVTVADDGVRLGLNHDDERVTPLIIEPREAWVRVFFRDPWNKEAQRFYLMFLESELYKDRIAFK